MDDERRWYMMSGPDAGEGNIAAYFSARDAQEYTEKGNTVVPAVFMSEDEYERIIRNIQQTAYQQGYWAGQGLKG